MVSFIEQIGAIAQIVASNLVVAAIILLVGVIIARFVERLVHYALKQLEVNKVLLKAGLPFALDETVSNIIKYVLYFATLVVTLNQIGLTTLVFNIMAAAVIIIVVVSIFLGFKDFFPNYWAGIWLYRKKAFDVGDRIVVNGIEGEVVGMGVLETTIKTSSGDMLYLPSSLLLHSQILRKKR
jgi:small conductance mechanosensitive channel